MKGVPDITQGPRGGEVAAPCPAEAPADPGLAKVAHAFLRYGNFTLGGGSATIAVLQRELQEKRRWVSQDDFSLSFALSRLTPGTNLLAFNTGIGWLLKGLPGSLTALLASSIPCTAIVILATALFSRWQGKPWVGLALHGAMAAAVAITVKTCWTLAHPHWKKGLRMRVAITAVVAFLLHVWLGVPPVAILVGAGVAGALFFPVRA